MLMLMLMLMCTCLLMQKKGEKGCGYFKWAEESAEERLRKVVDDLGLIIEKQDLEISYLRLWLRRIFIGNFVLLFVMMYCFIC